MNKEVNLIESIGNILEKTISKQAKDNFLKEFELILGSNYPSGIQRTMINRYFQAVLTQWREQSEIPVIHVLPYLCDDGNIEQWSQLFIGHVIPFIKENNVLGLSTQLIINKG